MSTQIPFPGRVARLVKGNLIEVKFPFSRKLLEEIRKIEGRKWDDDAKVWKLNPSFQSIEFVLEHRFEITKGDESRLLKIFENLEKLEDHRSVRAKLAKADSAPLIQEVRDQMLLDPYPYQWVPCHYFRVSAGSFLLADQPGIGKQQPVSEPVLTPNGWVPIGSLKKGDLVIGSQGLPISVIDVYPQQNRQTFKITFSDKTSTRCGPEHLWSVQTYNDSRVKPNQYRTMNTEQLLVSGLRDPSGKRKFRIPIVKAIQKPEQDLSIPPYILGLILGDGSVNARGSARVTTVDQEIILSSKTLNPRPKQGAEHIYSCGIYNYKTELKTLKLAGKHAQDKFIPEIYFRSSVEQRKELLAGLLDTDGYCVQYGGAEFSSVSRQLFDDVIELVRSLGGIAIEGKTKIGSYKKNGETVFCKTSYRVHLQTDFNPFKLTRKVKNWKVPTKYPSVKLIESIEPCEEEEAVCIRVDSPDHLYVTKDYILTHNSVQSLMVSVLPEVKHKTVLIVTPVPYTFQAEIRKFFGENSIVLENEIEYLNPRIRYYLVTYHRLKWLFDNREKRIVKDIWKDVLIIGDEAHNFKNRTTLKTKFMRALGKHSSFKLALTGTPVVNRPAELYEILCWLMPNFMTWTEFTRRYCSAFNGAYGRDTSGHSNLQYLREWLYDMIMILREKKQVLKQLPDKVRTSVEFTKEPIKVSADSLFELYSNSAQVKAAHPAFREWVSDIIDETEKVVIFSFHQPMLNAISEICKEKKVGSIRIDGQDSDQQKRFKLIEKFRDDPSVRVANVSIACGGTGLNGLQVAQVAAFAEFDWTPGVVIQCEDRLHRDGQKGSVNIFNLILTEFDYELVKLLMEKYAIIQRITSHEDIPDTVSSVSLTARMAQIFNLPLGKKSA